jgi:hypothetical protein
MTRHRTFFPSTKDSIPGHLLALLALLISALAPQGFMPTQTANGFSIKLCSGHADTTLAITPDHPDYELLSLVYDSNQDGGETGPQIEAPLCDFAAGSTTGLIAAASDITVAILAPPVHIPDNAKRFAIRNRIDIPPATGPPVTV